MDSPRLVLALAAVFAGLTTLLAITAIVEQPFLLLIALPFAATTYVLWYHASGRLAARARSRVSRGASRRGHGAATRGTRTARERARDRTRTEARNGRRGRARSGSRSGPRSGDGADRLSRAEALRRLGLEPGADQEEIRRAYRRRAKEHHPDAATGDEESFKRLTRAYERLSRE